MSELDEHFGQFAGATAVEDDPVDRITRRLENSRSYKLPLDASPEEFELRDKNLVSMPHRYLRPGKYQPRKTFDEALLHELAASIKLTGIIQPIVVRQVDTNHFEVLAGERRWRASALAGLESCPAVIRVASDEEAIAIALAENLDRVDLNPLEEAVGLNLLITDFGFTQKEICKQRKWSEGTLTRKLSVLKADDYIQGLCRDGDLSISHVYELQRGSLDQKLTHDIADRVVHDELPVTQMVKLIERAKDGGEESAAKPVPKEIPPQIDALRTKAKEEFKGSDVKFSANKRTGGLNMKLHYVVGEEDRVRTEIAKILALMDAAAETNGEG